MLGSRFDLSEHLDGVSVRPDPASEASCQAMEREIEAAVRTAHTARVHTRFRCPVCDDTMRLSGERAMTEFGGLDVKLHRLECDTCGMLTGRIYHPSVGYDALVR